MMEFFTSSYFFLFISTYLVGLFTGMIIMLLAGKPRKDNEWQKFY